MLQPDKIRKTTFTPQGKGAYRASEVDEFKRLVADEYQAVYNENRSLREKYISFKSLVDQYNASKDSIATAIIKSQALSDQITSEAKAQALEAVSKAQAQAEAIVEESKREAESYLEKIKAESDEYVRKAHAEHDKVISSIKQQAESYIESVNQTAADIISTANARAAKLVADSYADAKLAQDRCSEIVENARESAQNLSSMIMKIKTQIGDFITAVSPAADRLEPPVIDSAIFPKEATVEIEPVEEEPAQMVEPFEPSLSEPAAEPEKEQKADESGEDKAEPEPAAEPEKEQEDSEQDDIFSGLFEKFGSISVDSIDSFDDADFVPSSQGQTGYNGNNTSFSPLGDNPFKITEFDDEQ